MATSWRGELSPSIMWIPGAKLRSSVMAGPSDKVLPCEAGIFRKMNVEDDFSQNSSLS